MPFFYFSLLSICLKSERKHIYLKPTKIAFLSWSHISEKISFTFPFWSKKKKKMKVGNVWKKERANKFFSFEKSSLSRSWKQSWSVSSSFPSFSSSCDSSLLFPSFVIGEPQNNLSFAQLWIGENEIYFFWNAAQQRQMQFQFLGPRKFSTKVEGIIFLFYKKYFISFGHSFFFWRSPSRTPLNHSIRRQISWSLEVSLWTQTWKGRPKEMKYFL